MTKTTKLDLNAIRSLLFSDIDGLLQGLEVPYTFFDDNYFMRCPIHGESDNDKALSLSATKRIWRCWTKNCHEEFGTDIFGFIRGVLSARNGREASFSDVIKYIKQNYKVGGMSITDMPTVVHPEQEFCELIKVFKHGPDITETYYDITRDVSEPLVAAYAANGPSQYFQSRGFSESMLATFGVTDCHDRGSPFFRRSLIPIHSDSGEAIAIIARGMMDFILPKYIFTKGFKKGGHFYNWHRAIERATELSCMFICEGQGDVWRLWEAGVKNCCSLFGKELSTAQRTKLFTSEITTLVILTDNDQAGRESKVALQRELSRFYTVIFPRFKSKDIGELPVEKVVSDILPQVQGLY